MKISQRTINEDFRDMEMRGAHGTGFAFVIICALCVPISWAIAHAIFWALEMAIVYGGIL